MTIRDECYDEAIRLLKRSSSGAGFVASPSDWQYGGIWSRDAAYSAWGALLSGEDDLITTTASSLRTMASHQARFGQIPNTVWPSDGYWDWGENGSTDASALFILTLKHYFDTTHDESLVDQLLPAATRAASWLAHQDANNFGLIDSTKASDWMDSTLNRSGKVLYINVLYASAIRTMESFGSQPPALSSGEIIERINALFWPSDIDPFRVCLSHVNYNNANNAPARFPHETLPNAYRAAAAAAGSRQFYISHVDYGRLVNRCDVLANSLAIVLDVAPVERARTIAGYLHQQSQIAPFPCRSWTVPDNGGPDSPGLWKSEIDRFQGERWRNQPFEYHNAGVWPLVGGFYVAALCKLGLWEEADAELTRLASANEVAETGRWGFHEWLHGQTGSPQGAPGQAWSAGSFLLAFRSFAAAPSPA